MNILTFVLGPTHYAATLYIRKRVHNGLEGDVPNRFRNITNPNTLLGLRSTENTTIELVLLYGWQKGPKAEEFYNNIKSLRTKHAGIVEINA